MVAAPLLAVRCVAELSFTRLLEQERTRHYAVPSVKAGLPALNPDPYNI